MVQSQRGGKLNIKKGIKRARRGAKIAGKVSNIAGDLADLTGNKKVGKNLKTTGKVLQQVGGKTVMMNRMAFAKPVQTGSVGLVNQAGGLKLGDVVKTAGGLAKIGSGIGSQVALATGRPGLAAGLGGASGVLGQLGFGRRMLRGHRMIRT